MKMLLDWNKALSKRNHISQVQLAAHIICVLVQLIKVVTCYFVTNLNDNDENGHYNVKFVTILH